MIETFDVVILGGGAAGSAAALTLLKHKPELSVVIIEASSYEKWRVGETLSPDAGRAFRELGIWESFLETKPLSTEGTCAAWESDVLRENEFIFHPEGKGWHLNRVAFDKWMVQESTKKGAELRQQTRYVSHESVEKGIKLTLTHENTAYQLHAGLVVDALGRMSAFSRNEKVQKKAYDRLSASIAFFKTAGEPSSISSYTMVEAVSTGWWYSAPLDNERLIVAHMTDADILKQEGVHQKEQFLNLFQLTKHTCHRVHKEQPFEPIKVLSAASLMSDSVFGEGWISIGDAASTFDPLSSQGIYKGIRSGMFGAYAMLDSLNHKSDGFHKYARFIEAEYKEYLSTRNEFYKEVQRWPEADFWKRRY